jgi:hypothetical protein
MPPFHEVALGVVLSIAAGAGIFHLLDYLIKAGIL